MLSLLDGHAKLTFQKRNDLVTFRAAALAADFENDQNIVSD